MISNKCKKCSHLQRGYGKSLSRDQYCYCTLFRVYWHHPTETWVCKEGIDYQVRDSDLSNQIENK